MAKKIKIDPSKLSGFRMAANGSMEAGPASQRVSAHADGKIGRKNGIKRSP